MKKHQNFIGRLLRRNNADACGEEDKDNVEGRNESETKDKTQTIEPPEAIQGPTMCKGGKLYKARLRNGRWETMGAPIGDC